MPLRCARTARRSDSVEQVGHQLAEPVGGLGRRPLVPCASNAPGPRTEGGGEPSPCRAGTGARRCRRAASRAPTVRAAIAPRRGTRRARPRPAPMPRAPGCHRWTAPRSPGQLQQPRWAAAVARRRPAGHPQVQHRDRDRGSSTRACGTPAPSAADDGADAASAWSSASSCRRAPGELASTRCASPTSDLVGLAGARVSPSAARPPASPANATCTSSMTRIDRASCVAPSRSMCRSLRRSHSSPASAPAASHCRCPARPCPCPSGRRPPRTGGRPARRRPIDAARRAAVLVHRGPDE